MAPDITRHFAAAHRKAEQGDLLEIEHLEQGLQIIGEGVVLVTIPWLSRAAEATTVMSDDPIAMFGEKQRLVFPAIGVQRPAVGQDHCWTVAPILVVDL